MLLNNYVRKEIQWMLFPLAFYDKLYFTTKYSIKDNFIIANTKCVIAASVLFNILYTTVVGFVCMHFGCGSLTFFERAIKFTNLIMDSVGLGYLSTRYSQGFVDIIVGIQLLCSKLRISKKTFRRHIITNCFYFMFMLFAALQSLYSVEITPFVVFFTVNRMVAMNLTFVIFFIHFLETCLKLLAKDLECLNDRVKNIDGEKEMFGDDKDITERSESCLKTYKLILRTYCTVRYVFEAMILQSNAKIFIYTMSYVQINLLNGKINLKENVKNLHALAGLFINTLKGTFVLVVLCYRTERFDAAVMEILKRSVRQDAPLDRCEPFRRLHKAIGHVTKGNYRKLSLFDLATMDGAYPLRLCRLIFTYVFVLLQVQAK